MRKILGLMLCIMIVLSTVLTAPVSAASSVTVDLSSVIRPVTHCASGSLYGVIETKPDMSLILPTKPNCLINPAAAGYQQPWGAAVTVAQRFTNTPIGTKVQIRLADWFGGWYSFSNMSDWFNKMTTTVNAVKAAGLTNIYGYEIWNEPNGTWHNPNGMSFNDFYSQSQVKLKSLDSSIKTIGPSWAGYDHNAMVDFLTYQKNHNTLPDVVCWHDLFTPNLTTTIQDYRAIEKSLGISPKPIVMNEYSQSSTNDEGVPGSVAPLIAKFERFQLDNAQQSYWDVPHAGRLSSILATDTERNGGWWFYKWYGDMSGNMVNTTGANATNARAVDAFACVDSTKKYASILMGGVTDGSANVVIKNFPSFFGSTVHVRVDYTPFASVSTIVNSTIKKSESDYTISNGQITVPVTGMNAKDGYRIYITPYGQATNRYEAEDAAVNHANYSSGSNASFGKYVAQMNYSDSYVDFYVNVASAGTYRMTIGYANGSGANSTQQLSVNRGSASTVTYPVTAGWGQFGTLDVNVNLNTGDNIIRLTKGSTGYAELDYIEINSGSATPTPTATPSTATATPTPTPSTATATPTPTPVPGTATPTPIPGTATPTPTPGTPAPGGIKVQFFNGNTASSTNTIYPNFKLVNTGTTAINLSDVKVRYYFTNDGTQADSYACDYSTIGAGNVTGSFTTITGTNADRYLEVGFTSGAGTLAAGANAEVKGRIWKSDWSNFTQTNDYSFNATATNYVDATTVTGYMAGALKWGTEP